MNWNFLYFLGQPWFVIPWYAIGAFGTAFLIHDLHRHNTALKPAMKWAWPIIVFFFSVVGLVLYFATARAPVIESLENAEEKKKVHDEYERAMWRRVNGAVIHCVAGDGLGIMTAMVLARAASMSFWQEFWFEYVVGFVFGWFIFQRKSMTMMTDSIPKQLAMAFRGEFFSMLTVMGGMGAVMAYITPMVTTAQPKPLTWAFWGFGMFGLLVGFVFTWPMNAMLLKMGWKHGMGGMEGAEQVRVERPFARTGLVTAMSLLGLTALVLVAWLAELRRDASLLNRREAVTPEVGVTPGEALFEGVNTSIGIALEGLRTRNRTRASVAMDDAMRAADVGNHSAPGSFHATREQIRNARIALQQGKEGMAGVSLEQAAEVLRSAETTRPPLLDPRQYEGATVTDMRGAIIGEVVHASDRSIEVALGGWRDAWGFLDLSADRRVEVPVAAVVFGAAHSVGTTLVAIPTESGTVAAR